MVVAKGDNEEEKVEDFFDDRDGAVEEEGEGEASPNEYDMGSQGEDDVPDTEDLVYEDVELEELSHPYLNSALEDDDTELWLVCMPRHEGLRTGVLGSGIPVVDAVQEGSSATADSIAGRAKGYYVYRDRAIAADDMRATFVTKDATGETKMQIGKPFARSISLTFDVPLKSLGASGAPPRKYPSAPKGQKLKYFPIGSSKGKPQATPVKTHTTSPVAPSTPPSTSMSSPVKRRRVSPRKEHTRSPRSTRSQQANDSQSVAQASPTKAGSRKKARKSENAGASPSRRTRRVKLDAT